MEIGDSAAKQWSSSISQSFESKLKTCAVFGNTTMLYGLFASSEMVFLARCIPQKNQKNLGNGDLANGDPAFSYFFIAVYLVGKIQ